MLNQDPKPNWREHVPTWKELILGAISSTIAKIAVSAIGFLLLIALALLATRVPSIHYGIQMLMALGTDSTPAPFAPLASQAVTNVTPSPASSVAPTGTEATLKEAEDAYLAAGVEAKQKIDDASIIHAYQTAIAKADKAIERNPKLFRPSEIASSCCLQLTLNVREEAEKRTLREHAIHYLLNAEQLGAPLDGESYYSLGCAYQANGQGDYAKLRYHEAIDFWGSKSDLGSTARRHMKLAELRLSRLP